MYLGRVVGCVWATVKSPSLMGLRMLVVQPLTPELRNTGKPIVCTDCTGAGTGETVYWVRGKEASFPFLPAEPPTDTTIVGIVDSLHVKPLAAPSHASPKENSRARHAVASPKRGKAKPC
jgi:ethanolamine utilization protein EutN